MAWAAGIVDGEGSFYSSQYRASLAVSQTNRINAVPEMLSRLKSILGFGFISQQPRAGRLGNLPVWRWVVSDHEHVQAALAMLWPWLGNVKRQQARTVLAKHVSHVRVERVCRHCSSTFFTVGRTRHKLNCNVRSPKALFCSDKCMTTWHNRKRYASAR